MAFSAGTGVMPFLDLVALMLRDSQVGEGFKFTLFAAFKNEEDAVALSLLKQAQEKCSAFKLKLRFSDQKSDRWDEKFITDLMANDCKDAKQVWVCGTTLMNAALE